MGCFCSSEDTDVELVQVSDLENQIANSSGSSSHPGNEEDDHGFATNLRNFFSPKLFTSSYWEGNFKFAVAILVLLLCFFGSIVSGIYRESQKPAITFPSLVHGIYGVSVSSDSNDDIEYQHLFEEQEDEVPYSPTGDGKKELIVRNIEEREDEVPYSPTGDGKKELIVRNIEEREDEVPYSPTGDGKKELTVRNVNLKCTLVDLKTELKELNLALESDPSKVKWATSSSWTKRKERKRVNKKSLRLVITVSDSDKFHFEGDWRLHALCAPDDKLNKRVWKFSIVNGGKVTEFSGLHGKVVAHEKRSENHDSNDD
eukprot:286344_1